MLAEEIEIDAKVCPASKIEKAIQIETSSSKNCG
jgi:hypothetical protein